MPHNDFLVLKNVRKAFGENVVVDNLTLHITRGSMVTLLGPSGCGKTTVLRLIAGLESPDQGQILLAGEDITRQSVQQRDIGIVFQSYALFPHLSIGENIGYGLKMQGVSKTERRLRVEEVLDLVELNGFENRFVDQLSGGQQQRVALARALILKPKVLLFDEPLSNLDANLRRAMREKIRELQQRLNITAVYVTHDQTEAFAVSDQVVVMNKGKISQQGSAKQLYRQPNSRFIADFMGESSLFSAQRNGNVVQVGNFHFPFEHAEQFNVPNGACWLGIRPEAVTLRSVGEAELKCEITQAVYMGAYWELGLEWQGKPLRATLSPADYSEGASSAYLHFNHSGLFLLPPT